MTPDVLIVAGPAESSPRKTELAAVGFGLEAAKHLDGEVDLLLLGPEASVAAPTYAALGVRKVITIEHAELIDYTTEAYASALAQVATLPFAEDFEGAEVLTSERMVGSSGE